MRKAVAMVVLAAFAVLVLAVPAFAGTTGFLPPEPSDKSYPNMVTLVGKVVYSNIEKPHYELVVSNPTFKSFLPGSGVDRVYVLTGPFDFKAYEGKTVRVTGQVVNEPNIYQRGPVLKVAKIEPLSNTAPVPDPQPAPVTVSVQGLVQTMQAIMKALDIDVTYNNGVFVITNLANGKTVVLKF
ncbi:MAG: hypothetical protein K6U74_10195 [Firmicutes bacterium]|nr:hypothetical protein [Bacillota bacterium]